MSAAVDAERREGAREEGVRRARERLALLKRLVDLFDQGQSDGAIARALGWRRLTVFRWRTRLGIKVKSGAKVRMEAL